MECSVEERKRALESMQDVQEMSNEASACGGVFDGTFAFLTIQLINAIKNHVCIDHVAKDNSTSISSVCAHAMMSSIQTLQC